jgi:hypothetical protein
MEPKAFNILPRRRIRKLALAAIAVCSLGLVGVETALAAGLRISPTRVVVEGRTRSAEVTLINTGDEAATYRVNFINMRMTDDGDYQRVEAPDPGQQFADKMIRYAPRQVTVNPGEAQTVRLLVRKPKGLEEGEYRSHLMFMSVPKVDEQANIESLVGEGDDSIIPSVTTVYGLSIPVIVRQGKLDAALSMGGLALADEPSRVDPSQMVKRLYMDLQRNGDASIYGDIEVMLEKPGGDSVQVGLLRGLAVFTPNLSRRVGVQLNLPEGVDLSAGTLKAVFRENGPKQPKVLAEGSLPLS